MGCQNSPIFVFRKAQTLRLADLADQSGVGRGTLKKHCVTVATPVGIKNLFQPNEMFHVVVLWKYNFSQPSILLLAKQKVSPQPRSFLTVFF